MARDDRQTGGQRLRSLASLLVATLVTLIACGKAFPEDARFSSYGIVHMAPFMMAPGEEEKGYACLSNGCL